MRFIIGGFMVVLAVVMMNLINGNWELASLGVFLDAFSILFLTLTLVGVNIASGKRGVFVRGIKAVFAKECPLTEPERADAVVLFKLLRRTAIYAGVVGAMVAVLLMLRDVSNIDALAANFALSLLCVYYAFLINIILFNPAIAVLQRRQTNA